MIRVVIAASVLHNICTSEYDNVDYFLQQAENVSTMKNKIS